MKKFKTLINKLFKSQNNINETAEILFENIGFEKIYETKNYIKYSNIGTVVIEFDKKFNKIALIDKIEGQELVLKSSLIYAITKQLEELEMK